MSAEASAPIYSRRCLKTLSLPSPPGWLTLLRRSESEGASECRATAAGESCRRRRRRCAAVRRPLRATVHVRRRRLRTTSTLWFFAIFRCIAECFAQCHRVNDGVAERLPAMPRLLCLAPVFSLSLHAVAAQLPPAGYTPIAALSDEFDGTALDLTKWSAAASGWKGRQPGLFDAGNVVVGGGALQLWSRAAHRNSSWPAGYDNYTTAYVQSVATAHEGYFEMRWRSGNSSISSSWWFHAGNATEWTEIDVFESTGVDGPPRGALARDFASTTHIFKLPGSNASGLPARCNCTADAGGSCSRRSVWQLPAGQSFADEFHVAGLLWDDAGIRVFLDGALVNTVPSPCLIEVSLRAGDDSRSPRNATRMRRRGRLVLQGAHHRRRRSSPFAGNRHEL